jgi:hypothetical protein
MPRSIHSQLVALYLTAKQAVIRAGFHREIDWQSNIQFECVQETDFLREAAWVVLSTGFRESVIRRKFPEIAEAFLHWCSAQAITEHHAWCRRKAISIFAHGRKIDAIIAIAAEVSKTGFPHLKERIGCEGVSFLQTFPYIGPVTAYHLAKNLGLNMAKPDRHLVRAARSAGISSPQKMCEIIHQVVGDSVAVVDIVIWRYATINPQFSKEFKTVSSNEVFCHT